MQRSTAPDSAMGAKRSKLSKSLPPRWVFRVRANQGLRSCAMQYMAMEFMPTTTRGNAGRLHPRRSMAQRNPARRTSVHPVEKIVQEGVQMRFTEGQTVA